jgi:hypothetical protein
MADGQRLSGINPLAYMGVEAYSPPQLLINKQRPLPHDYNFNIGTIWVIINPAEVWMLLSVANNTATWVQLYPGAGGGASNFPCDFGMASEVGGVVNVLGLNVLETIGFGNTVAVGMTSGNDGAVPIAATGGNAAWANITPGAGINITNGPNSITIEATGGAGTVDHLFGDTGGAVFPIVGGIGLVGDGTFIRTDGNAPGHEIETRFVGGADGQVPIASNAPGNPVWANITGSGGIVVTNGPGSIDISGGGGSGGPNYAFLYKLVGNASGSNPIGNTNFALGQNKALTQIYDATPNVFYPGDGINAPAYFEAPEDGIYFIQLQSSYDISGNSTVIIWLQRNNGVNPEDIFNIGYGSTYPGAGKLPRGNVGVNIQLKAHDKVYAKCTVRASATASGITFFGEQNWTDCGPSEQTWIQGYKLGNIPAATNTHTSFLGVLKTAEVKLIGAGVDIKYGLGSTVALTEVYDTGGTFNPGNGAGVEASYTAPINGIYEFELNVQLNPATNNAFVPQAIIETSGANPGHIFSSEVKVNTDTLPWYPASINCQVQMNVGDMAKFYVFMDRIKFMGRSIRIVPTDNGGGLTPGVYPAEYTWVQGHLVEAL